MELDDVAELGLFVEIEGPSEPAVLATAKKLGLAGESVTVGYATLLARAAGER